MKLQDARVGMRVRPGRLLTLMPKCELKTSDTGHIAKPPDNRNQVLVTFPGKGQRYVHVSDLKKA